MRNKSQSEKTSYNKTQKFNRKKDEILKLTSAFANRLNKESVQFSTKSSTNKTPPSVVNVIWTILTPSLMFNVVKATPAIKKDLNKMLKFLENPVHNYNYSKPPFFLQLIEEHLNPISNSENQTLKDYLLLQQTNLTLALEKLITQVVVPTLMETGTDINLNKLRKKIYKHQADINLLPTLKEELAKLRLQYGADSKNKQLNTLEKKVLKLIDLESQYNNALIINILLKHGIDGNYISQNLVPIITDITHNLLSHSDQILAITSYALEILRVEDAQTKQNLLYNIFNTIDPSILLTASIRDKVSNFHNHHENKLIEVIHAIIGNPELQIAQSLIETYKVNPNFINQTIELIPKIINNLPVNEKQLTPIYNVLKEILTDNTENKMLSAGSLEQIRIIENASSGKAINLVGIILKEFALTPNKDDNITHDIWQFLLDPAMQENLANIVSNFSPQFFDDKNASTKQLADKIAKQLFNKKINQNIQPIHDIISSQPAQLLTNVPSDFFASNLPRILNIAANFLQSTSAGERRQFYMSTGNLLTSLGQIANLKYINEVSIDNADVKFKGVLETFTQLSKDVDNEIQTLEIHNSSLLQSIQDVNISSVAKRVILTKQQAIGQELQRLKKHAEILHNTTSISKKEIMEITNTLESFTVPRLTNIVINEHILPLIQNPDFQSILVQELSRFLLKEENIHIFSTIVHNFIKSNPSVRDILDKSGISLTSINNLILAEPNIIKPLLNIIGHVIANNPKELVGIATHISYIAQLSGQLQKIESEIKECKDNSLLTSLIHSKNQLVALQNANQSHITDQILNLLATNKGQLLKDCSNFISSLDQKQPILQEVVNSFFNNTPIKDVLKKIGIKQDTLNEIIPLSFNLLNKLFSNQANMLASIVELKSLKQSRLTNNQLTSFFAELDEFGIHIKIPNSNFDERIKEELALTFSKMAPTINPQDFYDQITETIQRLPIEWQKTIDISISSVNEYEFEKSILKYKSQANEVLLNSYAKLLYQNSFILDDIANVISPKFETLLNTQLKELNYKPLHMTLIGVDNPGEILKDTISTLSKLAHGLSTNLGRDNSEIMSILNTIYKFQVIDNKISNLNEALLLAKKEEPSKQNKINSISNNLKAYNKEKNQFLLDGINQLTILIKNYNSQDLLFGELSKFFDKHHLNIDLMIKNALNQEGILTKYLDIDSKQMLTIIKDNNERLLNIGNNYIEKNYLRATLQTLYLLADANVRDLIGQILKNFVTLNIFSIFRSSNKINNEVQTNLQVILNENTTTALTAEQNIWSKQTKENILDKKIPITERFIKRAAEIEKYSNPLTYSTKQLIYALRSRNLTNQTLLNIDLSHANIEGFNFTNSIFNNISFQNSEVLNTSFKNVKFVGTPNFQGATIDASTLITLLPAIKEFNKKHPKKDHITLDNTKIIGDISNLSFVNLSLRHADLTEATIIQSDLTKSKGSKTNFNNSNLEGVKFNASTVSHPDIHNLAKENGIPFPEQVVYDIFNNVLGDNKENTGHTPLIIKELMSTLAADLNQALHLDQKPGNKVKDSERLHKSIEKIAQDLKKSLENTPATTDNIRKSFQDIIAKHTKVRISAHRKL